MYKSVAIGPVELNQIEGDTTLYLSLPSQTPHQANELLLIIIPSHFFYKSILYDHTYNRKIQEGRLLVPGRKRVQVRECQRYEIVSSLCGLPMDHQAQASALAAAVSKAVLSYVDVFAPAKALEAPR